MKLVMFVNSSSNDVRQEQGQLAALEAISKWSDKCLISPYNIYTLIRKKGKENNKKIKI